MVRRSRSRRGVSPSERVGDRALEEIVVPNEMPLNPTGKTHRADLKRDSRDFLSLDESPA